MSKLIYPNQKPRGGPTTTEKLAMAVKLLGQANEQRQHLSMILWLALDEGGPLTVSLTDLMDWPADRVLATGKDAGTEKIVWTATTKQEAVAAGSQARPPSQLPTPVMATLASATPDAPAC